MRFAAQRLKSTSRLESAGFERPFCTAAACAFSKCHKAKREKISPSSRAANQTARRITPATSKPRSKKIEVVFALLKELPSGDSCVVSFSGKTLSEIATIKRKLTRSHSTRNCHK